MESRPCTKEYPGIFPSISSIGPGTSCKHTMYGFSRAIKLTAVLISALSLHTFQFRTETNTRSTIATKICSHYSKVGNHEQTPPVKPEMGVRNPQFISLSARIRSQICENPSLYP